MRFAGSRGIGCELRQVEGIAIDLHDDVIRSLITALHHSLDLRKQM